MGEVDQDVSRLVPALGLKMQRQSKFAQQHLSRRLVRQWEYDPPNLDIADLAAWAEGEVVIIGHYANGGLVDLGYVAGDCLRSCRLSASQQCGDEAAENRRSATAKKVAPSNTTLV